MKFSLAKFEKDFISCSVVCDWDGLMRLRYLGDSYDVVKQSLLQWLESFGEWSVLPMFTEAVTPEEVSQYASFLGATIVSGDVVPPVDRAAYLSQSANCGNLLLDPNTGLRLSAAGIPRMGRLNFLFADELLGLSQQRPYSLTLTFDQSLGRGSERAELEAKLRYLLERDIHAFAYHSHACFIISGQDRVIVERARSEILVQSRLPARRLISVD